MILGTHLLTLSTLLAEPVRYRRRHHQPTSKVRIAPFEENVISPKASTEPVIVTIPVKVDWALPKQRGTITSADTFAFRSRWPE
jgi:hypothetical protein